MKKKKVKVMQAHTHKYEKRKLGSWKKKGHDIYKCAIPGCTHYLVDMEMVIGRFSQCWGLVPYGDDELRACDNEVEMDRFLVYNEKRKHPLCESCKARKKAEWKRKHGDAPYKEQFDGESDDATVNVNTA